MHLLGFPGWARLKQLDLSHTAQLVAHQFTQPGNAVPLITDQDHSERGDLGPRDATLEILVMNPQALSRQDSRQAFTDVGLLDWLRTQVRNLHDILTNHTSQGGDLGMIQ